MIKKYVFIIYLALLHFHKKKVISGFLIYIERNPTTSCLASSDCGAKENSY